MNHVVVVPAAGMNLQATLSSASTGTDEMVIPHHPITCSSPLRLEGDGRLRCAHTEAPPDDLRTQYCIDHSVALLLIELSSTL